MHPALRLSNLDKLPISYRRIATAVCAPHPSAGDIKRFKQALAASPQANEDFLPAHYYLLDPGRILTAEQLDSCSVDTIWPVSAATTSISALLRGNIQPELGDDLWPRVWKWAQFFYTFHEFLSGFTSLLSKAQLCIGLLNLSHQLCGYGPNRAMITSTSGFQAILIRTWACIITVENLAPDDSTKKLLLFIVHGFLTQGPVSLDDRIEGAGGTIHDFAQLVISHFNLIATIGDAPLAPDRVWLLELVLEIVLVNDDIDLAAKFDIVEQSSGSELASTHPLCLALASSTVSRALTVHARTLGDTEPRVVNKCFALLIVLFKTPIGLRLLRVAVQNGLLLAIVACAKGTGSENLHDTLRLLLMQIVTPASVHYYVLTDLATASFAATQGMGSEGFRRQDVLEAWEKTVYWIQSRLEVLRAFDSKECLTQRACDNMECGIILERAKFRRCSGCRNLFYCSTPCQRRDWDSGHRESCVIHQNYRAGLRLAYTSREYAFVRALLHHNHTFARSVNLYKYSITGWPDLQCQCTPMTAPYNKNTGPTWLHVPLAAQGAWNCTSWP
ncbi:hypothetical protein DFH06DRAFT_1205994 [Mycena polygramma]|nr:hypothetical protein DFH06DRAFT_1205994 [Mycena polygramma]